MVSKVNDEFMRNVLIEEAWKNLSKVSSGMKLFLKNIKSKWIGRRFLQTATSDGLFL